jgi:hypothetical protein
MVATNRSSWRKVQNFICENFDVEKMGSSDPDSERKFSFLNVATLSYEVLRIEGVFLCTQSFVQGY